jgi:hypothetical protein
MVTYSKENIFTECAGPGDYKLFEPEMGENQALRLAVVLKTR